MRSSQHFLAGAATALAAVGVATLATGHWRPVHELTLRLPDGGVERVRYIGDAPPDLRLSAEPVVTLSDPFLEMERLSAVMDRQMALQESAMMADTPLAAPRYQIASAGPGARACMRSVEIVADGDGPPRVSTRTTGDCAAGVAAPLPDQARGGRAVETVLHRAPAAPDGAGRLLKTANTYED